MLLARQNSHFTSRTVSYCAPSRVLTPELRAALAARGAWLETPGRKHRRGSGRDDNSPGERDDAKSAGRVPREFRARRGAADGAAMCRGREAASLCLPGAAPLTPRRVPNNRQLVRAPLLASRRAAHAPPRRAPRLAASLAATRTLVGQPAPCLRVSDARGNRALSATAADALAALLRRLRQLHHAAARSTPRRALPAATRHPTEQARLHQQR